MYTNDLQNAALLFAGFTTSAWASPCLSMTIAAPAAYNATASKVGILKGAMKTVAAAGIINCANSSGNKWKYTGGAAATWYPLVSLAKPTAYTAAMVIQGGTMAIASSGTATQLRFWFDSYTSGGIKSQTAGPITVADAAGSGAGIHPVVGVFPTTQKVTVPSGGYLVARIDAIGTTARLYMNSTIGTTPAGATRTFAWNPVETSAGGIAGPVENRERFFDSTGTALPDGTKVYEYNAATMAYTGVVGIIGGAIVGSDAADVNLTPTAIGVGEVVFARAKGDTAEYFYIVPDPASGNPWTLNNAYLINQRVNPLSVSKLIAEITVAGTSGATEPVWPTTPGSTIVDGTATWTMVEVETICTNGVTGNQLGWWVANQAVSSAPADRVSPAGAGQYAVCTVAGTTGATVPVWPTTIVSGTTTVVDGTATWTMFNDEVYV